ncbi:DNA polymerase, partial [bacterium]|nr:DNA polymerase [bacterium]
MCPGIVFVKARHDVYVRYHHRILEALETCTPISRVLSIDEVLVELTGSQKDPAKAVELAKKMKQTVSSEVGEYLKSSVGIATNPLLAKVASDMQKPDGLVTLLKCELPERLFGLKLRDLPGVGAKTEKRLEHQGIKSVAQLCQFSQQEMRKIWNGIWGDRMYLWLRGEQLVLPESGPKSLGHQHVLEPAARNPESATRVLTELLVKAALRLRRDGFYARKLAVEVTMLDPHPAFHKEVTIEETQATLPLLRTLKSILHTFPSGKPLRVGVMLSGFVAADRHQLSLLTDEREDSLARAVDQINEKFGKNAVSYSGMGLTEKSVETKIAFQRIPDISELE